MAGDLIPPPSPAGKPQGDWEKGTFSESELLRTDAEQATAEALLEPEKVQPSGPSAYRSRFGFITGALVGVGIAAMVIVVLVVASGDKVREPAWSVWKPESKERDVKLVEIAQHVAHEYRLNSGDQLVKIGAQPLEVDGTPLGVVIRSAAENEGADIIDVPGDTMLYVLSGLGPRGSITSEEPSAKRLRLLQREAYELALYTFKYVKGVKSVVTFLPPPPPSAAAQSACATPTPTPSATASPTPTPATPANAEAAADGQPIPAMMFLPGDLEASLKSPLSATFGGEPPRPSTMTNDEASAFEGIAQTQGFNASIVSDQTGAGTLVLDRVSSSAVAQNAICAALKA